MKYQREAVVEKDWDGEFETYEEWAIFGPQPPYRSATFLEAHVTPELRCAIKASGQFGRPVASRRKSSAISRIGPGSQR